VSLCVPFPASEISVIVDRHRDPVLALGDLIGEGDIFHLDVPQRVQALGDPSEESRNAPLA
jgi:hypothetical protein